MAENGGKGWGEGGRGSLRKRALLLCVIPTLLLGLTYFLFVEFAHGEGPSSLPVPPLLRYGGGAIVLLFTLVALGFGSHLADGFVRPLRSLMRATDQEAQAPAQTHFSSADPELRRLSLWIGTLVQQNRSGAQALRELDSLRTEVALFTEHLRRALEQGAIPGTPPDGASPAASSLGRELARLMTRLRADWESFDRGLARLVRTLVEEETDRSNGLVRIETVLRDLEGLGTVWALEIEMARRQFPGVSGTLGSHLEEFRDLFGRLSGTASRGNGGRVDRMAEARVEIARMRETTMKWLQMETRIEQADGGPGPEPVGPLQGGVSG